MDEQIWFLIGLAVFVYAMILFWRAGEDIQSAVYMDLRMTNKRNAQYISTWVTANFWRYKYFGFEVMRGDTVRIKAGTKQCELTPWELKDLESMGDCIVSEMWG